MNGNFVYYPSNSVGSLLQLSEQSNKYKGFDCNWWQKDSFYKYDYLLVSAFHCRYNDFRERHNIPNDFNVMGDSGGFQAFTQELDFDPLTVLRWQEEVCNIGLILDKPPFEKLPGGLNYARVDTKKFKKAADITYRNAKVVNDNRVSKRNTKFGFELLNVMQGATVEEYDIWYNIMKEFEFDGWAVAPKPQTPFNVAMMMAYMYEKGHTNKVHILGLSGFNTSLLCIYMTKYFDNILIDSSSHARGMIAREYTLPYNTKEMLRLGDKANPDGTWLEEWPCICPVCSNIDPPKMVLGPEQTTHGATLLSLHNLYQSISTMQQMRALARNEDRYMDFVKRYGSKEAMRSIEFFNHSVEHGFESAYKKYLMGDTSNLDEFF